MPVLKYCSCIKSNFKKEEVISTAWKRGNIPFTTTSTLKRPYGETSDPNIKILPIKTERWATLFPIFKINYEDWNTYSTIYCFFKINRAFKRPPDSNWYGK